MKTITVSAPTNGATIITGANHCFRSYENAYQASRKATTEPGVVAYYDPATKRDVYLGKGEVSASDRSMSLYGRGGALVKVEVRS